MSDCCATKEQVSENSGSDLCPSCNVKGKNVKIITSKSSATETKKKKTTTMGIRKIVESD
ncbi:hypothetical protein [Peribacillus butanolivorans]|uniref:hypothetical protein n=1 Tax=Peribacillus butanolivorans TaxID=421767 RepID=UPI0036DBE91A